MASSAPKAEDKPPSFKLTEEEKAVLLECRRNSIARGLPLGVASVLALRWFVLQGRVPLHVQRWRVMYYGGVFLGTFLYGASSYRDTCFKKIMALENSTLADQVRKHMQGQSSCIEDGDKPQSERGRRRHGGHRQQDNHTPVQRNRVPPSPAAQPSQSHVHLNEGPSINQRGYSRDKALMSSEQQQVEQPDAFGGGLSAGDTLGKEQDRQSVSSTTRGRTFDEIREENRRQQLQQTFPRSSRLPARESDRHGEERKHSDPSVPSSGRRILRKNKYGDDVYEE